jgi:hypothetical protein
VLELSWSEIVHSIKGWRRKERFKFLIDSHPTTSLHAPFDLCSHSNVKGAYCARGATGYEPLGVRAGVCAGALLPRCM